MSNFKFDYDKKYDDLFIYREGIKSDLSVEIGDLIIDVDKKGKLVSMEISNASTFLNDLIPKIRVSKQFLSNLERCRLDLIDRPTRVIIKIYITPKKEKEILADVLIPIHRRSTITVPVKV